METWLVIKNYRGFEGLTIKPIERVNLIAGMNNVGKTALLEAIYLLFCPNLPEWPTRIGVLRGFEDLEPGVDLETKWGWLFYGKVSDRTIEISGVDRSGVTRSLQISWEAWQETVVRFGQPASSPPGAKRPGLLMLNFTDSLGEAFKMSVHNTGFTRAETAVRAVPVGVLLGKTERKPQDDAMLFSELMAVGRHLDVINALKIIEPRLTQLSVLYLSGIPMIYGDIGLGQLVPLPQMGEGMGRILSLVLEIARARRGIMLIDEIEHGLHHSVMVKVWNAIIQAARLNDTQIFATTHSWECIQAAHEAFSVAGPDDFRLHRLERIDGQIQAVTYDQETLATSVEMNLEVR